MAYNDKFAEVVQGYGGSVDASSLPDPGDVYDAVMEFSSWYDGLSDADKAGLTLAWMSGQTADTFAQAGISVAPWLLDAVDGIVDLEHAVGTAMHAIELAAEAEEGTA